MSLGQPYDAPKMGTPGVVHHVFRIQASTADGTDPDFIFPSSAHVTSGYCVATGVYAVKMSTVYPAFLGGTCTVLSAAFTKNYNVPLDIADYNTTTGVLLAQVNADDGDGTVTATYLVDNDWLLFDLYFTTAASDAVVGALAALTP